MSVNGDDMRDNNDGGDVDDDGVGGVRVCILRDEMPLKLYSNATVSATAVHITYGPLCLHYCCNCSIRCYHTAFTSHSYIVIVNSSNNNKCSIISITITSTVGVVG